MKVTTIRIPDDEFEQLETIAAVRGTSVSNVVRGTVTKLIADCATDEDYKEQARAVAADLAAKSERILHRVSA